MKKAKPLFKRADLKLLRELKESLDAVSLGIDAASSLLNNVQCLLLNPKLRRPTRIEIAFARQLREETAKSKLKTAETVRNSQRHD